MKRRMLFLAVALLTLCLTLCALSACDTSSGADETTPATQEATAEVTQAEQKGTQAEQLDTQSELTDTQTPAADTEAEVDTATETAAEDATQASNEEETTMEEITTAKEEVTTEAVTETPVAGMDSGIVRDGTPKKYFTIRFDDGITQDQQVIDILKKYDADCCTFYINTGLLGANWTWVGQTLGDTSVTHKRYTKAQLQTGIYDGFDVEVHTKTHPSLKNCTEVQVVDEVKRDATNITKIIGTQPVGMAWPGGDTEWNEGNIATIMAKTNIRYGSCTTRNTAKGLGKFSLPEYFMTWYPTCSFSDADSMALLNEFIAADCNEDMLFFVWCHSYELDFYKSWDRFDLFIKTITEAAAKDDTFVLVTNAEFYQLFKDEIPAWK